MGSPPGSHGAHVPPEIWHEFMSWKARLGKRAIEAGIAAEAFHIMHLPDVPISKDFMIFMMYSFFRQYLTLPENQKQQLEEVAREAKQIVDKLLVATA